MLAFDSETSGLDLRHSARPFFITFAEYIDGEIRNRWYEWDVNPHTRQPAIPGEDLEKIQEITQSADKIVGQNLKFDITAIRTVAPWIAEGWDWDKTVDTLIAGHLLASNRPHNLTDMAIQYLGIDIEPYEKALHEATEKARRYCRSHYPNWKIAKKGMEGMPSAKENVWKSDIWLPRMLWQLDETIHEEYPHWETVLRDYANVDSATTLALWEPMWREIQQRELTELFQDAMQVIPVIYRMEERGVTINRKKLIELVDQYTEDAEAAGRRMVNIAAEYGYELQLPNGASNNKSLVTFCFGDGKEFKGLDLETVKYTDSGNSSLDKFALDEYSTTLEPGSLEASFIKALKTRKKKLTSISYMESYQKFWTPLDKYGEDWHILYPSVNSTGTDTTRMSSSNPNSQQASKLPDDKGYSLRSCFGPTPDREWWSLDAQNIELRIPTFEAGEEDLMEVFLHPEKSPYYGSYHMVVFAALWPDLWEDAIKKVGIEKAAKYCKTQYESTYYQWTKNFDFGVIYGCGEKKGDDTAHKKGAWRANRARFPKIAKLSDKWIRYADQKGYVETIPLKGRKKGYPILCSRLDDGKIQPTLPLNYHTQSTASEWMKRAMVKVDEFFKNLNERSFFKLRTWKGGYYIILTVHDELVLDLPNRTRVKDSKLDEKSGKMVPSYEYGNLPIVREVQRLMESCGDDIGVPTPVSIDYHPESWAVGVGV